MRPIGPLRYLIHVFCFSYQRLFCYQVRNYLIYRTAKDSSVLITVQPLPRRWEQVYSNDQVFTVVDHTGQYYVCSAAIVDLDPKPFSKMPGYLATEKNVASAYENWSLSNLKYLSTYVWIWSIWSVLDGWPSRYLLVLFRCFWVVHCMILGEESHVFGYYEEVVLDWMC